jgi:GTPase SAR1 family protein
MIIFVIISMNKQSIKILILGNSISVSQSLLSKRLSDDKVPFLPFSSFDDFYLDIDTSYLFSNATNQYIQDENGISTSKLSIQVKECDIELIVYDMIGLEVCNGDIINILKEVDGIMIVIEVSNRKSFVYLNEIIKLFKSYEILDDMVKVLVGRHQISTFYDGIVIENPSRSKQRVPTSSSTAAAASGISTKPNMLSSSSSRRLSFTKDDDELETLIHSAIETAAENGISYYDLNTKSSSLDFCLTNMVSQILDRRPVPQQSSIDSLPSQESTDITRKGA